MSNGGDSQEHYPPDYMAGQCHVFAIALHRRLGFEFLVLLDQNECYRGGVAAVHHVYAVDADGWAYDFLGRHSAEEVTAQWLFPETAMSRPAVEDVATERGLQKYVEKTRDGWDRPLAFYGPEDVRDALDAARGRLSHLVPGIGDADGTQATSRLSTNRPSPTH